MERERLLEIHIHGEVTQSHVFDLWEAIDRYRHVGGGLVRFISACWSTSGGEIQELARRWHRVRLLRSPAKWAMEVARREQRPPGASHDREPRTHADAQAGRDSAGRSERPAAAPHVAHA